MENRVSSADSEDWRTIGRPGLFGRAQDRRQREFDLRFGPKNWRLRHVFHDQVLDLTEAATQVELSYFGFLKAEPAALEELCAIAADIYENARSNTRSGTDYRLQERKSEHVFDIALRRVVVQLGRRFEGKAPLQIGGRRSANQMLSPGRIPFYRPEWIAQPVLRGWWMPDSVLCFWVSNRILQARKVVAA